MKKPIWVLVTLGLAIGGCSGGDEQPAAPEQQVENHLFKAQAQALEKAKGVEQMLQDAADTRRREIEEKTH